jgi:hypothetical protein
MLDYVKRVIRPGDQPADGARDCFSLSHSSAAVILSGHDSELRNTFERSAADLSDLDPFGTAKSPEVVGLPAVTLKRHRRDDRTLVTLPVHPGLTRSQLSSWLHTQRISHSRANNSIVWRGAGRDAWLNLTAFVDPMVNGSMNSLHQTLGRVATQF